MSSPYPDPAPADPEPDRANRHTLLLILYALLTIGVLLITVFLASRAATPVETTTPLPTGQVLNANPTQAPPGTTIGTLTPTFTLSPTLRATFTPEPSATATITPTPSPTPTRTLAPSLTPAVPIDENERYRLNAWTPELAEKIIDIMEAYPESLSSFARGEDDSGYYAAFNLAILVQQEALLRFPAAPEAQEWLWKLAFNLARTGDPSAGAIYTNLITQELNAGRVQFADLYGWGSLQHPEVTIEVIPIEIPPGYLSNSLVKVNAGESGSAFFWMLEKPSGFTSFPLTSDFDFIHPGVVNYFISDLTGDGQVEAAIFRARVPEGNRYVYPRIFQLSQQPPVEIGFEPFKAPEIGPDFENHWEPVEPEISDGDLQFSNDIFPPCPVRVTHLYDWNGREFEFLKAEYSLEPASELLSYCSLVVDHAANVWGPETTIQIMEKLLPNWPPETTVDGNPYPEDALDEWRYRLSLYNALVGNETQATGYANAIVANPASPTSRWLAPAQDFLLTYQNPRDVYRVCLPSQFCDPRLALSRLVETFTTEDYSRALEILKEAGVTIRTSGFFDFDNDGETERWLILRHQPGARLEFWILAPTQSGVKALFVNFIEADQPSISILESTDDPPLVQVGQEFNLQMEKLGTRQEPSVQVVTPEVIFSADRTQQALDRIQSFIFSGGDPAQARDELIDVRESSYFTCSYILCPRFLYLLGLSHELAGEEREAVLAYLELWRQYLGHPLVHIARLKLSGPAIPPGPTITPTRTGTLPTATRSGTQPTASRTNTPTPTGTTQAGTQPSSTPTGTQAGYPYP